MRVVYYGKELYHAATGQRQDHKYIERIPVGNGFRYFYNQAELAAYNAGKAAKNAVDTAGNAIKDTVNGIKAKAIQRDLEKKGVGTVNTSLGDAYKTTSWTRQLHDRQLRDNLVNNKSLRNPPAWMPGKNGPKNNQGISSEKKSNAPKNNQGIARIKDSGNAPKNNQGIASTNNSSKKVGINSQDIMKQDLSDKAKHRTNQGIVGKTYAEGRNRPKYNQGISSEKTNAPTSNTANNKKNYLYPEAAKLSRQQDILVDKFSKSKERYKNEPSGSKTKSSKLNAYTINAERMLDNSKKIDDALNVYRGIRSEKKSNAPKNNQGIASTKLERLNRDAKKAYNEYKNDPWAKWTPFSTSEVKARAALRAVAEEEDRQKKEAERKAHNNSPKNNQGVVNGKTASQIEKKAGQSAAKRQKEIELSFYNSYVNDGHNSADARRWAKKAAENYMKKHK